MNLKILLVDDHAIIREGMRCLLERISDTVVIAEAENGADAVRIAKEMQPDVVVMDMSMPVMNGIDATRAIIEQNPATRVLALSMESNRAFVIEALKAGATGYLLKDSAFAEVAEAIETVARGETYLPQKISTLIVKEFLQRIPAEITSCYEVLGTKEREILQLIADGKSTKEIAFKMNCSIKTVENQRSTIMEKLQLHSIADLTKYALRHGLTH